jgi:hypothetical protein
MTTFLAIYSAAVSIVCGVLYLFWRDSEGRHRRIDAPVLYPFADAPQVTASTVEPLPRASVEDKIAAAFAPDPVTAMTPTPDTTASVPVEIIPIRRKPRKARRKK